MPLLAITFYFANGVDFRIDLPSHYVDCGANLLRLLPCLELSNGRCLARWETPMYFWYYLTQNRLPSLHMEREVSFIALSAMKLSYRLAWCNFQVCQISIFLVTADHILSYTLQLLYTTTPFRRSLLDESLNTF